MIRQRLGYCDVPFAVHRMYFFFKFGFPLLLYDFPLFVKPILFTSAHFHQKSDIYISGRRK